MSRTKSIYDRFQYFKEDSDCEYCLHNKRKGRGKKRGCGRDPCSYGDTRADAVANGRIKRDRGWDG